MKTLQFYCAPGEGVTLVVIAAISACIGDEHEL